MPFLGTCFFTRDIILSSRQKRLDAKVKPMDKKSDTKVDKYRDSIIFSKRNELFACVPSLWKLNVMVVGFYRSNSCIFSRFRRDRGRFDGFWFFLHPDWLPLPCGGDAGFSTPLPAAK